jgi:hypothetical protein
MGDHLAQFGDALLVGGDLRLQVGDVLVRVARRVGMVGQQRVQLLLAEAARRRCGNCRTARLPRRRWWRAASWSRARAADIGMVAARGDPEQDLASSSPNTGVTTVMSGRCVPPL